MPDNIDRVGIIAEVATATAAVTYPIMRAIDRYIARRRERLAKQYEAPAQAVEARLVERCLELEARVAQLEQRPRLVA